MDIDPQGYKDDDRWVALAAEVEPPAPPERRERPKRRPLSREAWRALAFAIIGLLGFGLVASPLALSFGHRARLASMADADGRGTRVAHVAVTMGKLGFALYLAIAVSVIPWFLFMLPLARGEGH